MTATIPALLAPVKARAETATEGPWKAWDRGIGYEVHSQHDEPLNMGFRETFAKPDAAFIAHARQDVPRLVAALEAVAAVHESVDALMNPGRHERVVKVCTGCGTDDGNWQRYPCPTVTAVVAALGDGQ